MSSVPPKSLFIINQDKAALPKFAEKLEEKFLCIKCNNVLLPPVRQVVCGHRICRQCLRDIKHGSAQKHCPGNDEECKMVDLTDERQVQPDFGTEREMKRVMVFCQNLKYGCRDEMTWSQLEKHLVNCPYRPVFCPNLNYGCSEEMPWSELERHKIKCPYTPMRCEYRELGCNKMVGKEILSQHLKSCDYRPIECKHCKTKFPSTEFYKHERECEVMSKPCPLKGCEFEGKASDLETHLSTSHTQHILLLAKLVLKLSNRNTSLKEKLQKSEEEIQSLKKNLEKTVAELEDKYTKSHLQLRHLQKLSAENSEKLGLCGLQSNPGANPEIQHKIEQHAMRIHRLEMARTIGGNQSQDLVKQEEAIQQIKTQISRTDQRLNVLETTSHNGTMIWKIDNFPLHLAKAKQGTPLSIYSQAFYTGTYGYKMCARMYPNGDGMGKDTHISLFFVLMRGEYDALLPWPFRQRVTMTLIDQDTGRKNHTDTFRPDPTSSSFKRPTGTMNVASGCPLFISQQIALSPTYMKEDTLYLKFTIDTLGINMV